MNFGERRRSVLILALAWLAYTISYLGRANYGATLLEIVNQTGVARSMAGMVASVFSICYAIGQITSAFLLKRFRPVAVVGAELLIAASINMLFPFSGGISRMIVLWGVNGCVQSTLLTSLTQIFVENLKEPYLSRSAVAINTVGAAGGVLNYVITWALLKYSKWQMVFVSASTLLFLFAAVWIILMPRLTADAVRAEKKASASRPAEPLSIQVRRHGALLAIIGCFFIGLLREGVSIWIPSYINDTFHMDAAMSIIVTVFVPMLQITGALMAGRIGRKYYNLHLPVCVMFAVSAFCMLILPLLGASFLPLTLVMFAANAICMTAALTFYLSLFPLRFFGPGQTATIVGVSNFCMHAGDFCASAGIGWVSESGGWALTFAALTIFALLAAALSAAGGILLRKEVKQAHVAN